MIRIKGQGFFYWLLTTDYWLLSGEYTAVAG